MQVEQKYRDGNIYLRPITYADTEDIIRWRNKDDVRSNFVYQELFTKETHEHWMKTMVETGKVVQMIICDIETGQSLGTAYIRDIDHHHHKGEYGMFVGEPAARGKGVGSSSARLMIQYGHEELGLHKVYMRVFSDNISSIKACEKAGFVKEGCLCDDVCINGEYRDMLWMAHLEK